jgi:hypothetical protein
MNLRKSLGWWILLVGIVVLFPESYGFTLDNTYISSVSPIYSSVSFAVFDYDNDGKYDVVVCTSAIGDSESSLNSTKVYRNTGSGLVQDTTQNLIQLKDCKVAYLDYDNDSYFDLFITGYSNGPQARLYKNINGTFIDSGQSFSGIYDSALALFDFNNNGNIDIFYTGCNEMPYTRRDCTAPVKFFYTNNNGVFASNSSVISEVTAVIKNDAAYGDYNNDGKMDLFVAGSANDNPSGSISSFYRNEGAFALDRQDNIVNVSTGSAIFTDIDNDGDLDLIISGVSPANAKITKIYTSDQSEISANTDPSPPSSVNISYTSPTLNIHWNKGTDAETPEDGLYYNLRVGSMSNPDEFMSGVTPITSNPNQGFLGNMMQIRNWTMALTTNKCIVASVQTIDSGLRSSAWSEPAYISFPEICDGYDNDCNGIIDNGCDKDKDGYADENMICLDSFLDGNGVMRSCAARHGDCDDNNFHINPEIDETKSPYCENGIDNNCDGHDGRCASQQRIAGGGGGSIAITLPPEEETPQEALPNEEFAIPSLPALESGYSSPQQKIETFVLEQLLTNSFRHTRTFQVAAGRTLVTEKITNLYPMEQDIALELDIPKDIAENTDHITKITDFYIIQYDPEIGFKKEIPAFGSGVFQYSFGKTLDEGDISRIAPEIILSAQEPQQKIEQQIEKTKEVTNLTLRYESDAKTNKTKIVIDIDVDKHAAMYNVSVFQEIPKCLVEIINEQMIESNNRNFEIINADPLIVWHFDNILDAKQIQFTIDAIADENCTNQLQALTVAKQIILMKKAESIDYFNVWMTVSIIPILALIMVIFSILSSKVSHQDEEINKLTDYIRRHYKHGFSKAKIREKLIAEGYPPARIDQCLNLHTSGKVHYWLHRLEIGFEEMILAILILLNILDFAQLLPGDVDFLKKIISWVLLSYVLYKASITEVLLGTRKRLLDAILLLAFFSLTFKNLISFAKVAWQEVNYVLDLYSFLITHNIIFEVYVFIAGITAIILISMYISFFVPLKTPSLLSTMHVKDGKAEGLWQLIVRFFAVHISLLVFFVIVFNLMMEWLAIAVDALIIVLTLIIMAVLIIKHHKKIRVAEFMEETSEFAESFYEKFIGLFHYKKTLYLGISGMLILHALTEVGNFVVPYLTGVYNPLYFGNFNIGHMPLFSWRETSLFMLQSASMPILVKTAIAAAYILNIIALIFMLVLPALVWGNYFAHRKLPVLEKLNFRITNSHIANCLLFSAFMSSLFVFLARPVFQLKSLLGGESLAGVDILTREIALANLHNILLIALGVAALSFVASFYYEKLMNFIIPPISFGFFAYYIYLFARSIFTYNLTQFAILSRTNAFMAAYMFIFGAISLLILYGLGMLINSYLYAPSWLKKTMHIAPFLNRFFQKHNLHHIHFYHKHRDEAHDTKEKALEDYILKSLDSGHELFYAVEHLVDHHWPIELIEEAINKVKKQNKYKIEVKHISHYHHNKEKVHELADWIKKMYKEHAMKDIIDIAGKSKWTEDDIILAFHVLKHRMKIRPEDREVMKYMDIIK